MKLKSIGVVLYVKLHLFKSVDVNITLNVIYVKFKNRKLSM